MKHYFTLGMFLSLLFGASAQNDILWGVNHSNGSNTGGELIKFVVNTSTNPFTLNSSSEIGNNVLVNGGSSACGIVGDYVFYIPYGDEASGNGGGKMDIYSVKTNGTSNVKKSSNFDLNGTSNDDLSFVRLGFDKSGVGWIVAKGSSNVFYVGNFTANNSGGITISPAMRGTFTITGGADFGSGDLAFDTNGSMYLLVNNNNTGDARIYVINATTLSNHTSASSNTNLTTAKWELKQPNGSNFSETVNGVAFTSNGSLALSTTSSLYYVDASTVNNPAPGNVLVKKIADTGNLSVTDLGSIYFTNTQLPVEFGSISAEKVGNQLKVSWQTLQEINVKEYVIEASADGQKWIAIGKLNSKAPNGHTDQTTSYEFSIDISGMTLAGLSLAFMLLMLPLFKSRLIKTALALAIIVVGIVACTKSDSIGVQQGTKNLMVRLVQNDLNGGTNVSKVVIVPNR